MGLLNEQSLVGNGPINGSKSSEYKPLKLVSKKYPHIERSEPITLFHTIEQLAVLEATLHFVVEGVNSKATDISFFCREYWGSSASMAQLSLDELNWGDPQLIGQIRRACALESLSMAALSQVSSGTMQDISFGMRMKLRKLFYNLHANCLVLLDLVRQRWEREGKDRGGGSERRLHCPNLIDFKVLVEAERYRQIHDGDHTRELSKQCEEIESLLQPVCEGGASSSQPTGEGGASSSQQPDVLRSVRERLQGESPLDRLRSKATRTDMLSVLSFQPLLNNGSADCPWPAQDPYERCGKSRFATGGAPIHFEPRAPVIADLDGEPFLPRRPSSPDFYTLVLDLDETLVHTPSDSKKFRVRPGVKQFLQKTASLGYELVIFTTATQDYADSIIDQIDPQRLIKSRLYRQHTLPWGPVNIKDLSRLGRDLSRTLIIDNIAENFMLQPQNGITIQDWFEDVQDKALYNLMPMLEDMVTRGAQVPDVLGQHADQIPYWAGLKSAPNGKLPVFQPQSRVSPAIKQPAAQEPVQQPQQSQSQQQQQGQQQPQNMQMTYVPVVMPMQPWSFVDASTSSAQMASLAPAQAPFMAVHTGMAQSAPAPMQAVFIPVQGGAAATVAEESQPSNGQKRRIRNAPLGMQKPVSSC